jgi:hypothetical protein
MGAAWGVHGGDEGATAWGGVGTVTVTGEEGARGGEREASKREEGDDEEGEG